MDENEIEYHLAAVQGSLPLIQSYLSGNNKVVNVDCVDEVSCFCLVFVSEVALVALF